MPELNLAGQIVPYTIRRSARARYVNFRINPEHGLIVTLPNGFTTDGLEALLYQRQDWILKHLNNIAARQPAPRYYETGLKLLFLGEEHELEIIPTPNAKQTTIARQAEFIRVRWAGGDVHFDGVREALEGWYRAQAKVYLTQRARELAGKHGFEFINLTIKGQRTRWGSCSSKGNLNFNWRLMMAPADAVDYVIIHELCHLREMNHSKRFWGLVGHYCPNYRYWIRWLKDHEPDLRL